MSKPKNKNNTKKKSLKHILTKRILKRIRRRAKVNRFNKELKKKVSRSLNLPNNESSVLRNRAREAAYAGFNLDQVSTANDLKMIPLLLADKSISDEKKLALRSYYDALASGQITAKDRDRFFGPIQSALLNSVTYDGFKGAPDYLKYIKNAMPSVDAATKDGSLAEAIARQLQARRHL